MKRPRIAGPSRSWLPAHQVGGKRRGVLRRKTLLRLDDEIDLSTLPEFLRLGATIVVNGQPVSDEPQIINVREGQTDDKEND